VIMCPLVAPSFPGGADPKLIVAEVPDPDIE
jgi:hypothetical protein